MSLRHLRCCSTKSLQSRLKNELASGIEQMERLTFVADDLYTMYESACDQRNMLLTWLAVQSRVDTP